jgi:replication factor C subunit 3/5
MTKTAQEALKTLIHNSYNKNVTFCLICNYITKIDTTLQNLLIKIAFNNLDIDNIFNYINNILIKENISLKKTDIINTINYYNNDIRSIVNFLQTNYTNKHFFINNKTFEKIYHLNLNKNIILFTSNINNISLKFNISIKIILLEYTNYIISNYLFKITDYNKTYNYIKDIELFFYNNSESIDTENILYIYHLIIQNL